MLHNLIIVMYTVYTQKKTYYPIRKVGKAKCI